eukprot:gene8074-9934_t
MKSFRGRGTVKNLKFKDTSNRYVIEDQIPPIPSGITKLTYFCAPFQFKLKPGIFPQSLKSISMYHMYGNKIKRGSFPNCLEDLSIDCSYIEENIFNEKGIFPESVKKLRLEDSPKSTDIIPSSETRFTVNSIFAYEGIGVDFSFQNENTIGEGWIPQSVTD